jgi:hypothetical protein
MAVPICKTCKYYIPDPHGRFESSMAGCKKIGTIDVVNGEIEYSSARSVREHACGNEGILYKPEPRLFLKEFNHNFKKNQFIVGLMVIYLSSIISSMVILFKK